MESRCTLVSWQKTSSVPPVTRSAGSSASATSAVPSSRRSFLRSVGAVALWLSRPDCGYAGFGDSLRAMTRTQQPPSAGTTNSTVRSVSDAPSATPCSNATLAPHMTSECLAASLSNGQLVRTMPPLPSSRGSKPHELRAASRDPASAPISRPVVAEILSSTARTGLPVRRGRIDGVGTRRRCHPLCAGRAWRGDQRLARFYRSAV